MAALIEGEDFYWDGPYVVFTADYHLRRGACCGSGCRHCPYEPRWTKGNTTPARDRVAGDEPRLPFTACCNKEAL
ncbi:MAG: DUF5522 domain-containing protein [Blastocatellia bacterium]